MENFHLDTGAKKVKEVPFLTFRYMKWVGFHKLKLSCIKCFLDKNNEVLKKYT